MNYLNEIIDLSQQLVSVMDDTGWGVISTHIHARTGSVEHHCDPNFFLNNFPTFDVQKRSSDSFPFEIRTEFDGVQFNALISPSELHLIERHLPESWTRPIVVPTEFISVQLEQIKNPPALACE